LSTLSSEEEAAMTVQVGDTVTCQLYPGRMHTGVIEKKVYDKGDIQVYLIDGYLVMNESIREVLQLSKEVP
jgi:uncharacterized protein YijF (DUF1287 family)